MSSELTRIHRWNEFAGNSFGDKSLYPLYVDLIQEELTELLEARSSSDVVDALADILVVTTGALHALGVCAEDALERVNDANYSKYDVSREDAKRSVVAYQSDSRYENVHYERVVCSDMIRYVIRGDKVDGATGKILKSHKFQEPDFTGILPKEKK